jgi:hypothetical protein
MELEKRVPVHKEISAYNNLSMLLGWYEASKTKQMRMSHYFKHISWPLSCNVSCKAVEN